MSTPKKARRLITSALPYVNNVPHLGNLIQVLSADVFARYCRLAGYETLYVCGTDEYGTATETRAMAEGVSPRELCDRYNALHTDIYRWFTIAFDKFGRTSTPLQTEIVQHIFKKLDENGFIVERTIEQLYCTSCQRFLADRFVRGTCPSCGSTDARGDQCEACGKLLDPTELLDSRCDSCGSKPEIRQTKHLYIDLPKLKDRLEAWIAGASVKGFWAKNAIQMTQAWIRDGLHERAITRDLKWGIPVPKAGFEEKVFYVWFDAPIGYISIAANLAAERGEDWKAFLDYWWKSPEDVELFQFIGKDNIPFHTVIFPSSLLGTGENWTMLHHMSSSEYLNYEGGKFSKSKGVGVFGSDAMASGIPADVWRFYIYYNRPEKSDGQFVWKDFQEKVNGELIGNLGNLVNRTLTFVARYFDGRVPVLPADAAPAPWLDEIASLHRRITASLERAELRDAFRGIFELSSIANKAFQDGEPWKTRTEAPAKAAALIHRLCAVLKDLSILLYPYIPSSAARLASFFGLSFDGAGALSWADLGSPLSQDLLGKAEVLFSKLEDTMVEELREKYAGSQDERASRDAEAAKKDPKADSSTRGKDNNAASPVAPAAAKTDTAPAASAPAAPTDTRALADRFAAKVALTVGRIASIERHPKADKLYVETVDMGESSRTIVSGLVPYYREEELLGKHIVVVSNLKSAKLRGVESCGMLLAASAPNGEGGETVEVLFLEGVEAGIRLALEGVDTPFEGNEVDIDSFFSMPIVVEGHRVLVDGKALLAGGKPVTTRIVEKGEVG